MIIFKYTLLWIQITYITQLIMSHIIQPIPSTLVSILLAYIEHTSKQAFHNKDFKPRVNDMKKLSLFGQISARCSSALEAAELMASW